MKDELNSQSDSESSVSSSSSESEQKEETQLSFVSAPSVQPVSMRRIRIGGANVNKRKGKGKLIPRPSFQLDSLQRLSPVIAVDEAPPPAAAKPRRRPRSHQETSLPRPKSPPPVSWSRMNDSQPPPPAAESSDNDSDLEVPYTQNLGLPGESQTLGLPDLSGQRKEPLRPGDIICYTSPIFVAGSADGQRIAQVLNLDPDREFPLVLDNAELLPPDTQIRRCKEYRKGRLLDHRGVFRPIDNFVMKKSALSEAQEDDLAGLRQQMGRLQQFLSATKKELEQPVPSVARAAESSSSGSDESSDSDLEMSTTRPSSNQFAAKTGPQSTGTLAFDQERYSDSDELELATSKARAQVRKGRLASRRLVRCTTGKSLEDTSSDESVLQGKQSARSMPVLELQSDSDSSSAMNILPGKPTSAPDTSVDGFLPSSDDDEADLLPPLVAGTSRKRPVAPCLGGRLSRGAGGQAKSRDALSSRGKKNQKLASHKNTHKKHRANAQNRSQPTSQPKAPPLPPAGQKRASSDSFDAAMAANRAIDLSGSSSDECTLTSYASRSRQKKLAAKKQRFGNDENVPKQSSQSVFHQDKLETNADSGYKVDSSDEDAPVPKMFQVVDDPIISQFSSQGSREDKNQQRMNKTPQLTTTTTSTKPSSRTKSSRYMSLQFSTVPRRPDTGI